MAQRLFHVLVRQHQNDAFTVAALTHPQYACFGADLAAAKEELARVLAGELALGAIGPDEVTSHPGLVRRVIAVTLKAVQHQQLISLPLRVTALCRQVDAARDVWEVLLPRLQRSFVILGEASIVPWAEEIVRGRFHLADVDEVRAHEHDRGERVDELVVSWRPIDGKRLERARGRDAEPPARETRRETEALAPDTVAGGMATDLGVRAARGELSRAYLRDALVDRLERALATRQSVLLVGPSGVGKTALVHELAHRRARSIWEVSPARVMAGAIFLGQWQERALELLRMARTAGAILYLGDLGALVSVTQGAAATGMSLPRLLGPFVRQREVTVLVEATPDALSRAEAIEPGFVDLLRRLPLPPLDGDAAFEVLARIARRAGVEHEVTISAAALHRALHLVARFGDAEGLPGSGIALVDRIARRATREARAVDALEAFCEQTGFPRALVDDDAPLDVADVRAHLEARVHGQPAATAALADVVAVLKAGLDDPRRPIASFLFMGPTGVGKTESALCLAEYLFGARERLVRLDMSEYAQPFSASRLVDGPGAEGDLTRAVRRQPFTVVLLDEIEKATPAVFDVLLQVLGEGHLTDATGRTVRFTHTIVILTSNLGATDRGPIGLGRDARGPDYLGAAKRFFRPELLNRIDRVVPFAPLDRDTVRAIARRMLADALAREGLTRRGVEVHADESVLDHLAAVGFDPALGARPMKRAVEARVLVPLAAALARGERRGALRLRVEDEALIIEDG